eukprot:TRINITY_DN1155_c0_g1_i3.p1 TRINITY_DN1155_c0_g1~~TRINITY_DN1155_c0_g1_i3.p1  ORF type:complete len:105 (+),score=8.74 TRINITY_DN1155_c0_g1_i3:521-835(+)
MNRLTHQNLEGDNEREKYFADLMYPRRSMKLSPSALLVSGKKRHFAILVLIFRKVRQKIQGNQKCFNPPMIRRSKGITVDKVTMSAVPNSTHNWTASLIQECHL